MTFHLAQVNIGRVVAPVDDPKIAGFMAQLDEVNALAEAAPGFVWRLQTSSGNATDVPYNDDPFVLVNMSVWESVETLRDYVYRSRHVEVLRDRAQWFQKMEKPHYCLWWVPAGHIPTVAEGRERLEPYQEHRPTPLSVWVSGQDQGAAPDQGNATNRQPQRVPERRTAAHTGGLSQLCGGDLQDGCSVATAAWNRGDRSGSERTGRARERDRCRRVHTSQRDVGGKAC